MPNAPKRACPRCRGTHARGEDCPISAARRAENQQFFRTPAWKRLRLRKLASSPFCECDDCRARGERVRATDVDHIVSRYLCPDLSLEWSNLASLAHGHHSRKTALVDGGFGR